MLVGELFDKAMANEIQRDLARQNISIIISMVSTPRGTLYSLELEGSDANEDKLQQARDYFRVKMGLPGPRPAPDPAFEKMRSYSMGPITTGLILISVGLFLLKLSYGKDFAQVFRYFYFEDIPTWTGAWFESLSKGQVWRLITPIFLHFNFLHIIFNSMWMKDLGPAIEKERGPGLYLFMIFMIGVTSNTLQYFAAGPNFGGLSGVVYGLLGYLWVYGHLSDHATVRLPKNVVVMMVGWYFLGLFNLIPGMANVAHGAGLGAGMLFGLFPWAAGNIKKRLLFIGASAFFTVGSVLVEIAKRIS